MLQRFKKYNKWNDIINWSEMEVQISLLLTLLIVFLFYVFDLYNNFMVFDEFIENVLTTTAAGFFGLLGFSLSGIAIIITLFSKEHILEIEKVNGKGTFDEIISSFEFIAFSLAIAIIVQFGLYFIVSSPVALPKISFFYLLIFMVVYIDLFNIFYTVSLVGNCVQLYKIRLEYSEIIENEKSIWNNINEIRIDYLISKLSEYDLINEQEFINEIQDILNRTTLEDKDRIMDYIKKRYGN